MAENFTITIEGEDEQQGNNVLGYQLNVDLCLTLVPKQRNITNHFDHMGNIVTLRRLPGEDNRSYKERLLDVYVHRGGSNYKGLVNGVIRNLDTLRYDAVTVDQKLNPHNSPRIDILADKIILYRKWNGYEDVDIEAEIPIYKRTDPGYYLRDLIDIVNDPVTGSKIYTMTPFEGVDLHVPTKTLIRKKSILQAASEQLEEMRVQRLDHSYIIPNTVTFGSRNFSSEIPFDNLADISQFSPGTFMINYEEGILYSSSEPNFGDTITYSHRSFPLVLEGSNVTVNSFRDPGFKDQIFNHLETDAGLLEQALPNAEGLDIIQELFRISRIYWGQ